MFKRSAFRTVSLSLLICILLVSCGEIVQYDGFRWVTLKEIEASLRNEPSMNVGFDIDDTVLSSSPGYYYGQQKYSPGSNSYLEMEEFWTEMNNGLDRFSLPKDCARRLIELHKSRGDTIYFITARRKTQTETVTELLAKTFNLANINPVIFTEFKAEAILANEIQIYYGDSDADMRAAIEAGIRGIRIMRAGNTTKRPFPDYGALGEEVIVDSEF